MNHVQTWIQGYFVDDAWYKNWTDAHRESVAEHATHLVKPHIKQSPICYCYEPEDAAWIASRLNLASKLEQMVYDFATGKIDEEVLVKFVRKSIEG